MAAKREGDDDLQGDDKKNKGSPLSEDAVVGTPVVAELVLSTVEDIVKFVTSSEDDLARDDNTLKAMVLRGLLGARFYGANILISEVRLFLMFPLIGFAVMYIFFMQRSTNSTLNVFVSGCWFPEVE
jgi:hypothetical protein